MAGGEIINDLGHLDTHEMRAGNMKYSIRAVGGSRPGWGEHHNVERAQNY